MQVAIENVNSLQTGECTMLSNTNSILQKRFSDGQIHEKLVHSITVSSFINGLEDNQKRISGEEFVEFLQAVFSLEMITVSDFAEEAEVTERSVLLWLACTNSDGLIFSGIKPLKYRYYVGIAISMVIDSLEEEIKRINL